MKADACQVTTLLGFDRQLFAPLFQRPYVWQKEEQWEPLWEDIRRLADRLADLGSGVDTKKVKPHFLGAVVLDQYRVPVGKPDARSIIDGQQRLTTLQLFLVAFRDCIRELGSGERFEKQARKLERLLFNEDVNDEVDRYKVLPTNIDRAPYRAVMDAKNPNCLLPLLEQRNINGDARVVQGYLYFFGVVNEWLAQQSVADATLGRIEALSNAVREKIRFVVIDMDEQDDAQAIFETLNARGTPLLPSDLIKNFLFRQAQDENADMAHLYDEHWAEFEQQDSFWRHKVGLGHAKRPRIDLYFQNYLTLRTKTEVQVGNVFREFCQYAEKVHQTVDEHLTSLQTYGRHFRRFMTPSADSAEGAFLLRLETMQFVTVYPFLLELFHVTEGSKEGRKERLRVLGMIESFLVRRMVCRLSTRGYNTLFLNLLKQLEGKDYTYDNVAAFLLSESAESGRFPDDKEFKEAWLATRIYEVLTRPRLKMILLALDEALYTDKTERYTLKGQLTVEHFLPQHWETHWKLAAVPNEAPEDYQARRDQRNKLLHTFGNLTLLTRSLNPAVSNGRLKAKKDEILKHSAINLNRFLCDVDSWDEEAIVDRGKALAKVACRIWKYPR